MNTLLKNITKELKATICSNFSFYERKGKVYLISPFYYDDGDGLHIAIDRKDDETFIVSDEGNCLMRLSYDLDMDQINKGLRNEIIESLSSHYQIENRLGEFRIITSKKKLADAIFRMIHFSVRLSDIDFLSKSLTQNTFVEDFKREAKVNYNENVRLDWFDETHDKSGEYSVDILIDKGKQKVGVFPMYTNHQIMTNTITIHQLRKWNLNFPFLGVIEDSKKVSESNVRKFRDVSKNIYFLNEQSRQSFYDDVNQILTA